MKRNNKEHTYLKTVAVIPTW